MDKMEAIQRNANEVTQEIESMLREALREIDLHVRAKTDQLKSDRVELNRQLYQILYAEAFIKKQSDLSEPLEFLNLNTGFLQVKQGLLNSWPIVSGDLNDMQDILKLNGQIKVTNTETNQTIENVNTQTKAPNYTTMQQTQQEMLFEHE